MARLSSDGLLIFSNNFRRFKLDEALASEFDVEEVSQSTLDKDFQRDARNSPVLAYSAKRIVARVWRRFVAPSELIFETGGKLERCWRLCLCL